jgi:hypothetical protein
MSKREIRRDMAVEHPGMMMMAFASRLFEKRARVQV